jgi:hypothetical protein
MVPAMVSFYATQLQGGHVLAFHDRHCYAMRSKRAHSQGTNQLASVIYSNAKNMNCCA